MAACRVYSDTLSRVGYSVTAHCVVCHSSTLCRVQRTVYSLRFRLHFFALLRGFRQWHSVKSDWIFWIRSRISQIWWMKAFVYISMGFWMKHPFTYCVVYSVHCHSVYPVTFWLHFFALLRGFRQWHSVKSDWIIFPDFSKEGDLRFHLRFFPQYQWGFEWSIHLHTVSCTAYNVTVYSLWRSGFIFSHC